LRLCALRQDESVACLDANDPMLALVDVSGLPQ
jgi:hypothetical protein